MMKLISYHIENYGKIHNTDGRFDEGITCFCEKNGYGKTTLASFIKAMFYGLPSYTAKTKSFDDRQHFYPFEGGKFGGNLTFEMKGKTYKIERFFDKKSNKGDECKVYCNGVPVDLGEDIGKELFGLDEEAFKKTIFITADEIEIASTYSINEKLNRDLDATDEDNNFESAILALEKVKKDLKAARGNNDRISEKKAEIAELTAQIENLKDMGNGLQEEYVERERLTKDIATLERAQKSVNEQNLLLQKWETADRMEAQAVSKKAALTALQEKYPVGVPSEEERAVLNECIREESALKGALDAATFSTEKEDALKAFEEKFEGGVPTEETLSACQQKISRLSALETEQERLSSYEKTQRERLLANKFSLQAPDETELSEIRFAVEEYKRKDAELKELSAAVLSAAPQAGKKKGKLFFLFFALAAALCLAGSFLLFVNKIAGGVLIACGAAALVAGIIKAKTSVNATMPTANVNLRLTSLQTELRISEEKIRAFTVPYGYYGNAGVLYDFATLEDDFRAYQEVLLSEEARQAQLKKLSEEKEGIFEYVRAVLESYDERENDLQSGLIRLRTAISSYASLRSDKEETERNGQSVRARKAENEKRVSAILQKYGFTALAATMDGLKTLEIDCKALIDLEKEVLALNKELTEYREKNGLFSRPEENGTDAEDLHTRLFSLRKALADCDKRISETERFVEKLPDVETALSLAEEQLAEYKQKHALIVDTIAALQTAEQNLKDRYIAPIKDRFSHYAEAIERVLDEKISMDKDFRVVFERGGENRSDKHLSAGERSICALCLRLALIDNMYEQEQPFIIMDDPFVHLDETHLVKTKALVKELSKDRQIVYFCCHESRRI